MAGGLTQTAVGPDRDVSRALGAAVDSNVVSDSLLDVFPDPPAGGVRVGETVSVPIADATTGVGESIPAVDQLTATASAPCMATIDVGDAADGSATVADDGASATIDVGEELPTLHVTGHAAGTTGIELSTTADDRVEAGSATFPVVGADQPPLVNGSRPTDVDGDCCYFDLTGNCDIDNQVLVEYFEAMDDPVLVENPDFFDCTGNGEVDYQDLIALWESIPA